MKNFILVPTISVMSILVGCNQAKTNIERDQNLVNNQRPWVADDTIVDEEEQRFYSLTECLQKKFDEGKFDDAKDSITELKLLLPKYSSNWNYGNATHKLNIITGRIALREGKIGEAKTSLIEAGKTQGSPQLNSFGPNMSLAKDLLEKKENQVVLQYFDLCSRFWKSEFSKLDDWKQMVKHGEMPNFGGNLEL